jgi:hypothetical protein
MKWFFSRAALLAAICFLSAIPSAFAVLIPASRLYNWSAGVTVGVPGGIPTTHSGVTWNLVTDFGADPTGMTNTTTAMNAADAAASSGDVILIPAGTYLFSTVGFGIKSGVVVRGAGMDVTILNVTHSDAAAVYMDSPSDTESNTPYSDAKWAAGTPITGTVTQGTTQISMADTTGLVAGDILLIAETNDVTLPVIDITLTLPRQREQKSRIVSVDSGTQVTILPGLLWTLTNTPQTRLMTSKATAQGLEDLTIQLEDPNGVDNVIRMQQTVGSWVKNVKINNYQNYGIGLYSSFQCEIRHCSILNRNSLISNGAGIHVQWTSNCLVEDNIIVHGFPHIEVNFFSSANVFSYNFCYDSDVGALIGVSIDPNHGTHNHFNLYEGNTSPKIEPDGYFGSVSDDTLSRNWFHGLSPANTQFNIPLMLNRFTRNYNVVGNILGNSVTSWSYYKAPQTVIGYNDATIMALGLPFIGGTGTTAPPVQPTLGSWWAEWQGQTPSITGVAGGFNPADTYFNSGDGPANTISIVTQTVPGFPSVWAANNRAKNNTATWDTPDGISTDWLPLDPNYWGSMDNDVAQNAADGSEPVGSTILKGNYNFMTNSIPANETTADPIPDSFVHASRPAFFGPPSGGITWPVFTTSGTPNPNYTMIPAGWRYVNGNENYLNGGSTWTAATVNVATINKIP